MATSRGVNYLCSYIQKPRPLPCFSCIPQAVLRHQSHAQMNSADNEVTAQDVSEGYRERCIHSEILKKYPGVNSAVHSHSEAVLPYGISGVEMKPCFHMAGFLGTCIKKSPSIHPSIYSPRCIEQKNTRVKKRSRKIP